MGQHASLDPRPGGQFAIDVNGASVRGQYLELDPPNRIVITWGFLVGLRRRVLHRRALHEVRAAWPWGPRRSADGLH